MQTQTLTQRDIDLMLRDTGSALGAALGALATLGLMAACFLVALP